MSPEPYYSDESVTLYLGDMREVLPALGIKPDCIVADPPYEETGEGWDRWPGGWLEAAAQAARSMWCWLPFRQFAAPPYRGTEFASAKWRLSHDIEAGWDHVTWEKNAGSGPSTGRLRRVHEPASHWYQGAWSGIWREVPRVPREGPSQGNAVRVGPGKAAHRSGGAYSGAAWRDDGYRDARSVIRANSLRGKAINPTEKPVPVLDVLIRYACPPGGLVLDPFAGSCSTLEAARACGRRAVGIELREQQAETAARRLSQMVLAAS